MKYETQNFLSGDTLTASQLQKLDKGVIAATSTRNLLDNSDFTNLVNQRGQTFYGTTGAYAFDRWLIWVENTGSSVAIEDGCYIGMNAPSGYVDLVQIFENASQMTGKPYTFAVMKNGATTPEVLNFTFGVNSSVSFSDGYGGLIHHNGDQVHIRVTDTGDYWVGFLWAAVYEGTYTAETLPPYIPKGFAAEYAECQRYFISPVGRFTPVVLTSTTIARMTVITAAPMRTTPTATLVNGDNIILNNGSGAVLSVTSAAVDSMEGNRVYLSLACSTGPQYAAGSTFVTSISLSADL